MLEDELVLLLKKWQREYLDHYTSKQTAITNDDIRTALRHGDVSSTTALHITELQITIDKYHEARQLPEKCQCGGE